VDLGRRRAAGYLAVNQREWSPTYARESFGRPEDSARIKDYRVYLSDDGVHWGKPVRTGAMASARGVQFIDLGEQRARYVKLEVLNTWAGPQAPTFYRELRIDEINVGYGYPRAGVFPVPGEAESWHNHRAGRAHVDRCPACSGGRQVTGLGGGPRNSVTYPDVTVAQAGDYRLQLDHTPAATAASLSVSVNGAAATDVPTTAGNSGVPATTAVAVPLLAGANTIRVFSSSAWAPGLDRISVGPLPPAAYVPKTTMTVDPSGVQWVGPGQQSIAVSASLRLDTDDPVDHVALAPVVPAGWSLVGAAVQAQTMRLGETLSGTWTVTSPAGSDVGSVRIPVTASFRLLGRSGQVTKQLEVRPRPADRVFMREAEDSRNAIGSAGITSCSSCSGGQKVRNIGGSPDAAVVFGNVTVDAAGEYTLFIDYTVNGDRSFFVTVNGGTPIEAPVSGAGNTTAETTSVRVQLRAGSNTIKIHNDGDAAPDLDRLSLG
jgi:hypothetical protein